LSDAELDRGLVFSVEETVGDVALAGDVDVNTLFVFI
jgi:hypothetical protein